MNDRSQQYVSRMTETMLTEWREAAQRDWQRQFDRILKDWQGQADRRLNDELGRLVADITKGLIQAAGGDASAFKGSNNGREISGLIERLIERGVNKALGGGARQRVTQNETQRSRDQEAQLRMSKGQIQAQINREGIKGQRNL